MGISATPVRIFIHSYDKAKRLGASNRGRYTNPEADRLIQQRLVTMNLDKVEGIFVEAIEIAMGDVALIPLHFQHATRAARSKAPASLGWWPIDVAIRLDRPPFDNAHLAKASP